MKVYWRKVKRGQNLILSDENDGHEEELGGFRDTKRGIDALAKTFSYDPSRSRKGFESIKEAKETNKQIRPEVTLQEYVEKREARDATLAVPKLLLPAIQANLRNGQFGEKSEGGKQFIKIPVNAI